MTNRNYYTPSNYADHSTFGGLIYYSDFNTTYRGNDQHESSIARRIMNDWKFDQDCERDAENRDNQKKHEKKGNN